MKKLIVLFLCALALLALGLGEPQDAVTNSIFIWFGGVIASGCLLFFLYKALMKSQEVDSSSAPPRKQPTPITPESSSTPEPEVKTKPTPSPSITDAEEDTSIFLKLGLFVLKYGIICMVIVFCTYNIFYDKGFEAGRESGYYSGYENGQTDGYKEGYAEGKESGYNLGYQNGKTAMQDGSFELVSDTPDNRFSTRSTPEQSRIVYVTKTGTKYHKGSCYHLSSSKIEIDLASAKVRGYTPCSHCGG